MVHEQPELLPFGAVLQCVPVSAARGRHCARRCAMRVSWSSEGYSILIFPEGRRSENGEIDAFRPGVGMLASRLGIPVVPVRIEGRG